MPKKSIEINPFDGGLNDFADARDIKENELATATNINTEQPGRIKIGKRINTVSARTGTDGIVTGKGLFSYSSDYNTSNSLASTEYQLLYNNNTLLRRSTSDTNFTSISSLGASYDPDYYSLDGNIRLSDGNHSSDTKFIGVTDVDNFGNATSPALTIVNSYIDPPTSGDITFDPADSTDPPSGGNQNDNYLDMIIKKKTGSTEDWFTFDFGSDSDTAISDLYNNSFSNVTGINITESNYSSYSNLINTSVSLNGASVNAQSGKCYRVMKGATNVNYSEASITFASAKSFEDKSIFIDVYVPTATKSDMEGTIFTIEVGNQETDHYTYFVDSNAVTADSWTTLEFQYGKHNDSDGSPNASGVDYFKITGHFQNNSSTKDFAVDNLKIGDASRGTWNGRFKFYYSWIYDNTQESVPFLFGNQSSVYEVENKILQFRAHMKLTSSPGANDRITGANIYYVEFDLDNNPLDTDKKLLIEMDVEKGIMKANGESFEAWGTAKSGGGYEAPRNAGHTNFLQMFDPPVLQTFSTKAGYDENDKLKKMKYKTSVAMNRRSYVGNVKITNQYNKDITYSDRVYKSEPNMPDVYTENGYVDVAINDGESITALAHFGDMLLQFKESTLYLINCTQEIEYLEDTAKFRGVWGQSAVCETDEGIVWVNKFGLFLFNGKGIIPLIDKKIDPENWNSIIGDKPMVGYLPIERNILIVGDSDNASDGYIFSLKSQGFGFLNGQTEISLTCSVTNGSTNVTTTDTSDIVVGSTITGSGIASNTTISSITNATTFVISQNATGSGGGTYTISKKLFLSDMTNLTSSKSGVLSWYEDTGSNITEYKWSASTNDVFIDIMTRDQDFKDPARRKMVKNVYLTYKVPSSGSVPNVKFRTNGGTTDYNFNSALSDSASAGNWYTITLKANTQSQANDIYSFQVRLFGVTHKDFEINDINVVYRDKVLK